MIRLDNQLLFIVNYSQVVKHGINFTFDVKRFSNRSKHFPSPRRTDSTFWVRILLRIHLLLSAQYYNISPCRCKSNHTASFDFYTHKIQGNLIQLLTILWKSLTSSYNYKSIISSKLHTCSRIITILSRYVQWKWIIPKTFHFINGEISVGLFIYHIIA